MCSAAPLAPIKDVLELLDRVSKYITDNLDSMKRMWMSADMSGWVDGFDAWSI